MKLCFILSVLVLVTGNAVTANHLSTCAQSDKSPNVDSFWDKNIEVSFPCKYNAVRQTCGKYFINVSPGIMSKGYGFRLDTMWLGIKRMTEQEDGVIVTDEWEGRCANKKAVKFVNGNITELYAKKRGNLEASEILEFFVAEDEDGVRTGVAREKDGSFEVTFTPWDPDRDEYKKSRWSFTCHEEFEVDPYPQQVCGGDESSGFFYKKVNKRKKKYGLESQLTGNQMFLYNVFADIAKDIAQVDEQCIQAETIFQDVCPDDDARKDAIVTCGQFLTVDNRRKCVTQYACSAMHVFVSCMDWVCTGYVNDTLCEEVAFSIDFCKANFSDGNLVGKIEEANCYKDFLPILG